jgi:hypothetical protein
MEKDDPKVTAAAKVEVDKLLSDWRAIAMSIEDIRATPFEKHLLAAILLAVMESR